MLKGSATLLSTLCLLLLMTAALSPAAGAAETAQETQPTTTTQPSLPTIKIPSGSYMETCKACQFEGTTYSCQCKSCCAFESNVPSYGSTKIDLTTCTVDSSGFYDLTNSQGKLICTTS